MSEPLRQRLRVAAAFLAVYLIWGSTYLAIRFAIETMPPFLMAGFRYLLAGAAVYAWALVRERERPSAAQWRAAFILGGLFFLGGNGAVVWAERRVSSGLAALLIASTPLWVVLLEWLRPGGRRPSGRVAAGLALGIVGIVLLVQPGKLAGAAGPDPAGAAVLIAGALSWATGSVYSHRAELELPRSLVFTTAMEMIAGSVLLVAAGLIAGELGDAHLEAISLHSLGAFAYLVVFGSVVAFNCFVWLLQVSTPSLVSTYAYVNPVVAVILGWLLAGESLTAMTVAGAAVIVASVASVTAGQAPTREPRAVTVAEELTEAAPPAA